MEEIVMSPYRKKVLEKITLYEKEGLWNKDVEDDGQAIELLPNQIDYLNKKLSNKIASFFVNVLGNKLIKNLIKSNQLIIERIDGIEKFIALKDKGVILTCNHFYPFDNFAVWHVIKEHMKGKLWKVIKEGNYTNPSLKYKKLFRHGNTLPLSQNKQTMMKFMRAIESLLNKNQKILIYPEQSMWFNYRKPRPLQPGAFKLAVKNNAPVLPIFITMTDSEFVDGEGLKIQKYTINFCDPIFPDLKLNKNERIESMKQLNYQEWVAVYENFYKKKLVY